jgi:hypothetical protein
LINKLEFIDNRLKEIGKHISQGKFESTHGNTLSQLDNVMNTIWETIKRINSGENTTSMGHFKSANTTSLVHTNEVFDKGSQTADSDMKALVPPSFYRFFAKPLKCM